MERLILFRHGKALAESDSGDDFDRRLDPLGMADAAEVAQRLAQRGCAPDLALVSAAARTRETWAAAEPAFPRAQARFDRTLYLADPEAIQRAVEAGASAARTLMVIGHNPGLQDLTVRLLTQGGAGAAEVARARRQFPPAAASVFLIAADGSPRFDGLFYPERRG